MAFGKVPTSTSQKNARFNRTDHAVYSIVIWFSDLRVCVICDVNGLCTCMVCSAYRLNGVCVVPVVWAVCS